jgi:hypothetical protein
VKVKTIEEDALSYEVSDEVVEAAGTRIENAGAWTFVCTGIGCNYGPYVFRPAPDVIDVVTERAGQPSAFTWAILPPGRRETLVGPGETFSELSARSV